MRGVKGEGMKIEAELEKIVGICARCGGFVRFGFGPPKLGIATREGLTELKIEPCWKCCCSESEKTYH